MILFAHLHHYHLSPLDLLHYDLGNALWRGEEFGKFSLNILCFPSRLC